MDELEKMLLMQIADLHKVPVDELNRIADRVRALGIDCSVAG